MKEFRFCIIRSIKLDDAGLVKTYGAWTLFVSSASSFLMDVADADEATTEKRQSRSSVATVRGMVIMYDSMVSIYQRIGRRDVEMKAAV